MIRAGSVSIDYLGEDVTDVDGADATVQSYLRAAGRTGPPARRPARGCASTGGVAEALGVGAGAGSRWREDRVRECADESASVHKQVGAWVTVDAEDHTTTDSTLSIAADLRSDFPWLGVVVQAYLRRTLGDCAQLAEIRGQSATVQGGLRRTRIGRVPGCRSGHRLIPELPSRC